MIQELEIKDVLTLPSRLYHLVPKKIFDKFSDNKGNYDCRSKKEWGGNSLFIHTSPTKEQLKERVADTNWTTYPLEEKFLLLEIDPGKIKAKFTYVVTNNYIYHHIWGNLSNGSFKIIRVDRSIDGKFLI